MGNTAMIDSLNLGAARLVHTEALFRVEQLARLTVPKNEILVVHGEHGTGKYTAVASALAGTDHAVHQLDVQPQMDAHAVIRNLYRDIVDDEAAQMRDMQDDLTDALANRERVLVVRNAHRLTGQAGAQLQWLHARPNNSTAFVLVGGPRTLSAVDRDPVLGSRLSAEIEFKPLTKTEIVPVLQRMHDMFLGAGPELLLKIDATMCLGRIGRWAQFLTRAVQLCDRAEANGRQRPVLDGELAQQVAKTLSAPRNLSRPS